MGYNLQMSSENSEKQIGALMEQLQEFGVENPSQDLAKEYGLNKYWLQTTQQPRLEEYFQDWERPFPSKWMGKQISRLAFANLKLPLFGVSKEPSYMLVDPRVHLM